MLEFLNALPAPKGAKPAIEDFVIHVLQSITLTMVDV